MFACLNKEIASEDRNEECPSKMLVRYIIENFEADPLFQSPNGTPLISAIEAGNYATVAYLVEGGPKISANHKDSQGMSAFFFSVYKGDFPIMKLLLDHGGDPMLRGVKNSNVIHICAERGFLEIASHLLERDSGKCASLIYQKTECRADGGREP